MPVTKSHNAKHLVAGVTALAVASAMAVATAAAASATPPVSKPVEDLHIVLPAGLACAFDLRVDGTGSKQTVKTFTDQGGNEVKVITAGKGYDLTFTKDDPGGKSITFPSNGSVQKITFNADGTQTVQTTGHNVVILFPTDVPPGPSTTLYTGRLVYTVDTNGVFTVQGASGRTSDICALLA